MEKYLNKYRIPSARANWHDYNGGIYFVTICTKYRKHYFGEIVVETPRCDVSTMRLSEIGRFTDECIRKMDSLHADISVPLYQIMPDHIHLIVVVRESVGTPTIVGTSHRGVSTGNESMRNIANQCGRLSHVISQFKSAVTKYTRQCGCEFAWQTRFHDRIVRNQDELDRISYYIEKNVENWSKIRRNATSIRPQKKCVP